jgi:thioredoxin-related protein
MRVLYLCLFFVFIPNAIAQNNFKFDESDYQTLLTKSKTENKPIFLMLYASWCPHCEKMKHEVLTHNDVIDALRTNYISAWQDVDSAEGKMLKNKVNVTSYPTFVILDSNGTELYRLKGEYTVPDFIAELNNALNPKLQLPYLEKDFNNDPSQTQKWLDYMTVLKKGRDREYLAEKAAPYFATQTDAQLISSVNWQIIANCVTDISSREFQSVLHHQKEYEAASSPLRVERKIMNIVIEMLQPLMATLDTVNYYKKRALAKTIGLPKVDALIFRYDLTIEEQTKNWSAYKKTAIESTEKYAWSDAAFLKEIATQFLNNITDTESLKKAIKWTQRSLEFNDSYDGNLLLSNLYLKINDKKSAIQLARKAKEICIAYNFNSKEVDALFVTLGIK